MKILYLSAALLPSEKSNSLSIMRVCQAFADAGHLVTLAGKTPNPSAPEPMEYYGMRGGFSIVRQYIAPIWDNPVGRRLLLPRLSMALRARPLIEAFAPDLIYSRLTTAELLFVPRDIPIVYEMHSLGPLGSRTLRPLFLWLTRNKYFRRVIVTTDALAAQLRKQLPNVEVTVARLSAEPPVVVTAARLSQFHKTVLQGTTFKYHVGYTGYLDTFGLRGTDIICKVAARMPSVAFHIVGGKPEIVEHWRRFAADYNTNGNIYFYGYHSPDNMPLFLTYFDIVLAPLQYRPNARANSPLKIAQYMAYSKAIVASDIPAHRELLKDKKTALLVRDSDITAWVDAIQMLIAHPDRRTALGQSAHSMYSSNFTPTVRIQRILDGIAAA